MSKLISEVREDVSGAFSMACGTKKSDILSKPFLSFVLCCLPANAIVASGYAHKSEGWRTAVWTTTLSIIGGACIANATRCRCRRIHCYVTGPFFLLMALGALLYVVGVIPPGANGWNLIGMTILIVAIILSYLPELLFGKYRNS